MTQNMKEWMKPELTVLVRSKPQEAVLAACKKNANTGPIAATYYNCLNKDCDRCSSLVGS
jgi:hypothetical protein